MQPWIDLLTFSATYATIAVALFAVARLWDRRLAMVCGVAFAVYLGLDDFVTGAGGQAPLLFLPSSWNWSGKLYSLALASVALWWFKISPKAAGLVLPYQHQRSSWATVAVLVCLSTALALVLRPRAPSLETLVYQATLPGMAEEIAYRGVAPALFLGWVSRRETMPSSGARWAAIVVTALMFSVWHGLSVKAGHFSFDVGSASFTLVGGVAYGWLRFRSGSVLCPMVAHCLGNLAFQLVPYAIR